MGTVQELALSTFGTPRDRQPPPEVVRAPEPPTANPFAVFEAASLDLFAWRPAIK
jgi:hypothetical protein